MITFKQIGDELKNQRDFLGLSRREVANRAGIAHSTLGVYENGHSIHVNTLNQIVGALGLTMADFYAILEGYGAETDATATAAVREALEREKEKTKALKAENRKLAKKIEKIQARAETLIAALRSF